MVRAPVLLALLCILGPAAVAAVPAAPLASGSAWDPATAVPLRGDPPPELTPEVHEKVLRAGAKGLGYDVAEDREVALPPDVRFIRPGAWMMSPSQCLMAFVHGSPGGYQMSTAGFCTSAGDPVILLGLPTLLVLVGRTSMSHDAGLGATWALVDISPSLDRHVDPGVPYWGGPEGGAYAGDGHDVQLVKLVGRRTGVLMPHVGAAVAPFPATTWACVCPGVLGDAGAPVLASTAGYPVGQALGFATHAFGIGQGLLGTRMTAVPAPVAEGGLGSLPAPR